MEKSYSNAYKEAGVDITAGYKCVELMKAHVSRTMSFGKVSDIGGFGGMYELGKDWKDPVLVSGTDGVGTKLAVAMKLDKHDTVGIDCVAMCVNDIICCGAKPLFFLDYIATGRNIPEKIASIVSGVAEGCVQAKTALIGGETAEHPGMMKEDEYDIAGFTVGIVERDKILNKENVQEGDVLIALPSSGIHSNGFSLVRKVFDVEHADLSEELKSYGGKTLGEVLLTPTRIYVEPVLKLLEKVSIRSIANITGGGFFENIPRALPEGLCAEITISDVRVLPIFDLLQERGNIPTHDMYNTFNMGVGMVLVTEPDEEKNAIRMLRECGIDAYRLGIVRHGEEGVRLC